MATREAQALVARIDQLYEDINDLIVPGLAVLPYSYVSVYKVLVQEAEGLVGETFPIAFTWENANVPTSNSAAELGLKPLVGQLGQWVRWKMELETWAGPERPKRVARSYQPI